MMSARQTILDRLKRLPAVMIAVLVLIVAGTLATLYEDQIYRSQNVENVTAQAQILAASVTAAVAFDDEKAAQEYVSALKVNSAIEAAAIYDTNNHRIAGFTRDDEYALPSSVILGPTFMADNRIFVTVPIRQENTDIGIAYLQATMESFTRRLTHYLGIILLAVMAAFLLAIIGIAHRALATANLELEQQARELALSNQMLKAEMGERERIEEALRQSQKMEAIGQLSGGIAHDFNNLLTIIRGSLQLLQKHLTQGKTDVGVYINAAMESLDRAANLTRRILAFSRRQPLSPKRVQLSQLIEKMQELIRHSAGESVGIERRLNADWEIMCDENQMESVILNLLVNARDAMPEGGTIYIETENRTIHTGSEELAAGDYVRLSIRDTGTGMSEDVRQKAIDPFFTTKPQGQGTGLGLSMAFGYIRQSNGHFNIQSELGKGTEIAILMPRYVSREKRQVLNGSG